MNKSESKYFATAARMDEAFLELIEKKDFAYITVKEICEKAGVNRSTFYLHYETVGDLLEESVRHIIDRFVEFMPYDTADFLKKLNECPLEELYLITPEYLTPYRFFCYLIHNMTSLIMSSHLVTIIYYIIFPPICKRT